MKFKVIFFKAVRSEAFNLQLIIKRNYPLNYSIPLHVGYGCARPSNKSGIWLIGPLFAERYEDAYMILQSLQNALPETDIFQINVPSCNPAALKLINGLELVGQCSRMYTKGRPQKPNVLKVFAATSLQLG